MDRNNNFKKQFNHVMNMVDNEVNINNWRTDLVIQEFLYFKDFLLVSLPGLILGYKTKTVLHTWNGNQNCLVRQHESAMQFCLRR